MGDKKKTKAELQQEVDTLTEEVERLRERLGLATLSEEAVMECRAVLAEVGHERTYFDDAVRAAVMEIKARRYDCERYERMTKWKMRVEMVSDDKVRAKRPKDIRDWNDSFALAV